MKSIVYICKKYTLNYLFKIPYFFFTTEKTLQNHYISDLDRILFFYSIPLRECTYIKDISELFIWLEYKKAIALMSTNIPQIKILNS